MAYSACGGYDYAEERCHLGILAHYEKLDFINADRVFAEVTVQGGTAV
ncbi:MAG: hypothetical protein JXA30_22640 [Deltaproteobacteria bacterium]|nr:hypothetical protein [Deltaproteobacteria bacterium]